MKLLNSCQNWEISVCVQKKKEISVPTCGEISPPFFWLVISQSQSCCTSAPATSCIDFSCLVHDVHMLFLSINNRPHELRISKKFNTVNSWLSVVCCRICNKVIFCFIRKF